jgi:cytochrome c
LIYNAKENDMNAIRFKTLFLISLSAVVSIPAIAAPAPAAKKAPPEAKELKLAQAKKCLTCHTVDKKLVGPAWKDVAAKYRGQKDAEAKLIQKVAKGGSGVWGPTPMPPNSPQVSQSDIKTLVRFILRLK